MKDLTDEEVKRVAEECGFSIIKISHHKDGTTTYSLKIEEDESNERLDLY